MFSDDAELSAGSNPDDPNSRPIGFVSSGVRIDALREPTANEMPGGQFCVATPGALVLRQSTGSDGSGSASVIATPQVNILRMGAGEGGGLAGTIAQPSVVFRWSDADFESGLEPFVTYSRSSSRDWQAEVRQGQKGALIDNAGGGVAADDWLISPPKVISPGEKVVVNFDYFQQGGDGLESGAGSLRILVSTNYLSGDPASAVWSDMTPAGLNLLPNGLWHTAREASITGVSGTGVRIAFRYRSTGTVAGQAKAIGIDNVYILEDFYQPPAISGFLADGVEITEGLQLEGLTNLSVTSDYLARAEKAQFVYRKTGSADYTVIGQDVDFSDGAGIAWPLSRVAKGDYQLAARLWSGSRYTEISRNVKILNADVTGPVLTELQWEGLPLDDGLVVRAPGAFRIKASDPSGISRVDFFLSRTGEPGMTLLGSDADGSDGYTAYWGIGQTTPDGGFSLVVKAYDALENLTSQSRALQIVLSRPAVITTQPADQAVAVGSLATFRVVATGTPAPSLQWYRGNSGDESQPVAGANSATFVSPPVTASTAYWVKAWNTSGPPISSATATARIQLLVNGGFELPVVSGRLLSVYAPNSTTIPGWSVVQGDIEVCTSQEWIASEGAQSLDTSGVSAGAFYQDVSGLVPGGEYRLDFDLGGNPSAEPIKRLKVEAGPAASEFEFDVTGHSTNNIGWVRRGMTFVAESSTARIRFQSLNPSASGAALDNVSLVLIVPPIPKVPPLFTFQPVGVTIPNGSATTLIAAASGNPEPGYQWYLGMKGDTTNPIAGANATALTTPVLYAAASYWLRATNSQGNADSETAVVTVQPPVLQLELNTGNLIEGATTAGTLRISSPQPTDFVISLGVTKTGRITFPSPLTIPAGQVTLPFTVQALQNQNFEGTTSVTIIASATGSTAAVASLKLLDDDTPEVGLTLDQTLVSENGAATAVHGLLAFDRPPGLQMTAAFDVEPQGQLQFPSNLLIPANSNSLSIPITILDNAAFDGNRQVRITAHLIVGGETIASSHPVQLGITDDEGPSLSFFFDRGVFLEGRNPAGTGTVTRSQNTTGPATVTLASAKAAKLILPATVSIPAGRSSVSFPVQTVSDATIQGNQPIQVTASAPTYNAASATVIVTDAQKPDLAVSSVSAPTGAETDAWIDVRFHLSNQGATPAKGPFTQRILLSTDPIAGDDVRILDAVFTGTILPGSSIEQILRVKLPRDAGHYWLLVQADADGALAEILEDNNLAVSAIPIDIAPAYNAVLSILPTKVGSGTPIPISGTATLVNGKPAAFVPVNIHVVNGPVKRLVAAVTSATGRFNATFTPLPGEGGLFQFGAAHPGGKTAPVQDTVQVFGIRAEPASLDLNPVEDVTLAGTIVIRNLTSLPITGVKVGNSGLPVGLAFSTTPSGITIPASGEISIGYSVSSEGPLDRTSFNVSITTFEGATLDIPVTVTVDSNVPKLVAKPDKIEAGAAVGKQQLVNFVLTNTGKAASGPVNIRLPAALPWMRLSTPMPLAPIAAGASVSVTVQLTPPAGVVFGDYQGTLVASDGNGTSLAVPFNFRVLSDQTGQLLVRAEDEYTYYASGNPYLSEARVKITSVATNEELPLLVTDSGGMADFGQVPEGYYDIEVTAGQHSSFKGRRLVRSGIANQISVFLSRQTVTHRWTVVPVYVEDRYKLTVDTQFETSVPVPVITVDPAVIDVSQIKTDDAVINVTLTNHGLIAAQGTQIHFPKHPLWEFSPTLENVGILPANSSIIVPLVVRRIIPGTMKLTTTSAQDDEADGPCFAAATVCWALRCGGKDIGYCETIPLPNLRSSCWGSSPPEAPRCQTCNGQPRDPLPSTVYPYLSDSPWPKIPPLCPGCPPPDDPPFVNTPSVESPDLCETLITENCDPCVRGILVVLCQCFEKFLPDGKLKDWTKCGKGTMECGVKIGEEAPAEDTLRTCSKSALDCAKAAGNSAAKNASDVLKPFSYAKRLKCVVDLAIATANCIIPKLSDEAALKMLVSKSMSPKIAESGQLPPGADILISRCEQFAAQMEYLRFYFGSLNWFDEPFDPEGSLEVWLEAFGDASNEATVGGSEIAESEKSEILRLPLPGTVTRDEAAKFIERYNRSIHYWRAGIFRSNDVPVGANADFWAYDRMVAVSKAALEATQLVEDAGFASSEEAIAAAKDDFLADIANSSPGGVCAKVKLRLKQDAVFARDAFQANLELENSGNTPIENVRIQLAVITAQRTSANELFNIQLKQKSGIAAVDGTGTLGVNGVASLQWLLVPDGEAAPSVPTNYWVGGTLSYVVDGQMVEIPFSNISVTVLPCPRLTLKYFHQRDVFSDDPFTPEIEPSRPYSLAVMVQNTGAGMAHDFQIASAQPTIIENEKGLLADFKIIATQVGLSPLQPSLTVNFGDIGPNQIKIGQWLFTSSIQGLFTDYDATFQHIDDAGGERSSLITRVEIHEMNHQVKSLQADDGLPAFLVNDTPDAHDLPDTIYLSDGTNFPVSVIEAGQATGSLTKTLTVAMPEGWSYLRIPEPSNGTLELTKVVRSDGLEIPLDVNVWVTDRTFIGQGQRPVLENRLHLLDYDSTGSYTLTYQAKRGPDTVAPESRVTALPANSLREFPVSWTGTDDRGIAFYDVYVSTDGGPYAPWVRRSLEGGAIFQGEMNHRYSFYSRATDAAGNAEAAPAGADAVTMVNLANLAPVLPAIATKQVTEGGTFTLDAAASDPDGRGDSLTYSITTEVPPGLTINTRTGQLHWVTGEADGGREVSVTVKVTDSGVPMQSATRTFLIRVLEENTPPVLEPVEPQDVTSGGTLLVQLKAMDANLPGLSIQYRIVGTPPDGMTVNAVTGLLSWHVLSKDSGRTVLVTVGAKNSGTPAAESTLSFPITVDAAIPEARVNSLPSASSPDFTVSWRNSGNSPIGSYTVYVSSNGGLTYAAWLVDTKLTSGIFHGQSGKQYSFYVVARSADGVLQPANPAISSVTTLAVPPVPPNGFDETLDFETNKLPAGWAINVSADQIGRTGVANKRFEARSAYTFSGLYRAKELPAAATGFQINYRGNITANSLGQSTQIRIYQKNGSLIQTYLGKAGEGLNNIYAEAGLMDNPEYTKMFALKAGDYNIKALFNDGKIVYSATAPGAAAALFDITVPVPGLAVHKMYLIEIYADTSSPGTSWFDDVVIKAIKPVVPKVYKIEATAKPATKGTVGGARSYDEGKKVTLKAKPKKNFKFVSWTENGKVVSKKATYTFNAAKNRKLVANFK